MQRTPRNRRIAWAAVAVAVAALAAGAWLFIDDLVDEPEASASTKASQANRAETPRRPGDAIPFSPSRTNPQVIGPGVPHKTPPAASIPPRAPMRSMLTAYLQKANAQPPNAEAAISAYELLTQCRRLAANPPAEPDPNAPDCDGVTEADWKDAPRLLKLAAELGNERAQLTYAQRLIGIGREPDELAATREELAATHQKARQYLESLAERGNVDGMWFLGESLRLGESSEPNYAMAYAYKYAVARAGGYPYTIDSELMRLESQLSPADQARAREFADKLIARCCSKR